MFRPKIGSDFWGGIRKLSESLPYFIECFGIRNLWGMRAKIHNVENLLKFGAQIAKKLWRVYNGITVHEIEGRQIK